MANITITLLTNKRIRTTIDAYDVTVAMQPGGYSVIAGEHNATEIEVRYPDAYASRKCSVYMKNAKGEYVVQDFDNPLTVKSFTLPDTMTFAGNTTLVFSATDDTSKTIWSPVIVPVVATGIDYRKLAMYSTDILDSVVETAKQAIETANATNQSVAEFSEQITKSTEEYFEKTTAEMEEFFQNTVQSAQEFYQQTAAEVERLSQDIGSKQGSVVRLNGVAIGDYEIKNVVNDGDSVNFDGGGV